MARTKLFVSYSHKDIRWLERLQVHLRPLEKTGLIDVWDDTRIKPGSNWRQEIRAALAAAKAAVLLVSADFLASEFITTNELPPVLAAAKEEGSLILPVIVSPCLFTNIKELEQFQAVNSPERPLLKMKKADQEAVFLRLAKTVLEELEAQSAAPAKSILAEPSPDAAVVLVNPLADSSIEPGTKATGLSPEQRDDATRDQAEQQSLRNLSDREAANRLKHFKRLLEDSRYVFQEQEKRVQQLHALLEKRIGSLVPDDVGYDQTFFLLYDEMNEEERELFRLIRAMTNSRMRLLNEEMRQWAEENSSLHLTRPQSGSTKRLGKKLKQLRLHLDLWFDRYNRVFATSERRCLVFMLDLKVPGVSFPVNLEKTVEEVLQELE